MTEFAAARLFTDGELAALTRSGTELMVEGLESGSSEQAAATYDRLEQAMRAFCVVYLDWLALTDEYVFETHGHEGHAAALRPERTAELAIRTGLSLADLVDGQALVAGPDNRLTEQVHATIRTGDRDGALRGWHEVERILRDVHDLRRDLISDLLGHIYRVDGPDGLQAAQEYCAPRGWWRESMPRDFAMEPTQRLTELAFMLTVGAFSEDDRWVVHQLVCGNCGRQVRDRYADTSWGLETVTEQGPMTFGQPALTIYQTHLAIIHHMYAIDIVGAPWPSFDCVGLRRDGGHCRLLVYKDPARTAPEFYEMVGRPAPSRGSRRAGAGAPSHASG
jgi:hypothetical protein